MPLTVMNCPYCKQEFTRPYDLRRHEGPCIKNPNSRAYRRANGLVKKKPKRTDFHCIYCNKEYYSGHSVGSHERCCELNPSRFIFSDELKKKLSDKARSYKWTDEQKAKHSSIMRKVVIENKESYSSSNVSGRVKLYEFDGSVYKGKWELAVAKSLTKSGIRFTNRVDPIPYFWPKTNKIHLYFPDFYLIDFNLYLEVKGYERERDHAKWKCIDNLIVLRSDEIDRLNSGEDIINITGSSFNGKTVGCFAS